MHNSHSSLLAVPIGKKYYLKNTIVIEQHKAAAQNTFILNSSQSKTKLFLLAPLIR
jgi:hypothetical protein